MHCLSLLLGAAALVAPALAQTWTLCNPLNTTCPNNPGFGIDHTFHFNSSKTIDKSFNSTAGALVYGSQGAEFTINKRYDSPTIQSYFYIMFGSVSVIMQAASGQGIVSSIVLQSEDLDEIDWEFIGGNGTHAQTNYFGKGNTTSFDRAQWHPVDTDVRHNFHNYTTDWTAEKADFYIDGKLVRTLKFGDANGGKNYPQTPATVRLGIWAGGDESNNKYTVEWAGGKTDYSRGPFTMYVSSSNVRDYGTGKEYEWTDRSGSWQSIKSIPGNSTAAEAILQVDTPSKSVAQKFNELPQGTKLAVYAGGGAAGALLLFAVIFTCIRQRRKGRKERDAYNAKVEKEREQAYQDQMELREKGLGGWDPKAYATQGDDALGGWGGSHVAPGTSARAVPGAFPSPSPSASPSPSPSVGRDLTPPVPKLPINVASNEMPSRVQSPLARQASPASWNGGNVGGMIHNAHNARNGGYNGGDYNQGFNGGNFNGGGYGNSHNVPRSPNFPLSPHGGFGTSHGGYQRF